METIWIDAPDFEERGGFILETQFIREMGQPYLLANGIGHAVAPASTVFRVKEGGSYRFYIRTKNWCTEHNPDGLVIEIDGEQSEHVCALMHVRDWYFEIAADRTLTPGEHTLKVCDTTGYFARFSSVIITNDYDFTPSKETSVFLKQRAKIKELETAATDMGKYDYIVVGGGVGGIVSAIAAARYGLRTALINDRPRLGGNAAEEANVALEGSAHRGYHEGGIVFEIKSYREKYKTSWSEAFGKYTEKETFLDVFSNMLLIDATAEDNSIKEILTLDTNTLKQYKFSADIYADATGDGWLGYYSGAAYRIGREAEFQHGESFAPKLADGCTMSGCATAIDPLKNNSSFFGYLAYKTDGPVKFEAPSWAFKLPEGDELGRTPARLEKGEWWLEMPNDYDDLFENEFTRDSMIRMAVGYFDWMKNSWREREKAANYSLRALGTYNAKRESRRLIGDYLITENDFTEGKSYFDSVGYCGWNIDVHHQDGIFSGKCGRFTANKTIPITPIPFGALYSKNINNLLMTGRCISVTHVGLGPTRVQMTAGILGQAIATAAYLCKKHKLTPRSVRNGHVTELQQLLIKDGIYIPGFCHNDVEDIAKHATVSATSFTKNGMPENIINKKTWNKDGADYAWISEEPLPQSILLTLEQPRSIREIRITFDVPFDDYKYGYMAQPAPSRLATAFSISVLKNGEYSEIAEVADNIQRLVVLPVAAENIDGVMITVKKALNSNIAVISEVRIY